MEVKYRLEKLNEVQFAYDENRRRELEAKGFKVVNDPAVTEQIPVEAEEPAETDSTAQKSRSSRKAARKSKEAEGEEKNA